eukprot:127089_1
MATTESKEQNIEHSFVQLDKKEQLAIDEKEQNKQSVDATAIVVIGRTGAGKSSLIHLFANAAKIGHGINSQTTGCHLYEESTSRYFLDSQGASDSNNTPDDQVLRDILKALYDANISNIKVIWCVSGDTQSRAAQEFKKQAKFIKNNLGANSGNIWQSCLIIKKQGNATPSTGLDGLLGASTEYGSNIKYGDSRLFGYSFYDANTADNTVKQALKFITDPTARTQFLKLSGFWNKNDIKNALNKLLAQLPVFSISFTIKKCSKCGSKGDPRFVFAKCHTASEKHHPKGLIKFHPNQKVKYHPAKTPQSYHPKEVTKYHSGYVQQKSHHPGYKKSIYYHPKGSYWNWFENQDTHWRWKCCEKFKYYGDPDDTSRPKDNGCTFAHDKWTCCGYSGSSGPCTSYYAYSCCGGSKSAEGCKLGFGCCHRATTDRGCKLEWSCCKKSIDDKGCLEKYSCCNAPDDNKGCKIKYECCNKPETDKGCEERCSNASCHVKWGDGPGCVDVNTDK